jgi:outer membrane protein assembly factor BamB
LDSGRQLHDIEVFAPEKPEPIHYTNTYASPTPVVADGRVYVHFGTYGNACLDAATGEVLWKNAELHVDHQNGPGSSPVLWNGLLIIHYDGIDQQFVAALKAETGQVVWKTDRSGELNPRPDMQKAYATPTIVETEHGAELISPGADWVYGYDPETGSELWKVPYGELGFSTVPCPVVGHDLVYVCTSFMKSRLLAIELNGDPGTTRNVAWASGSQIPKKPSLLLVGDNLYVGNDSGIVTCLDAHTGEEKWRGRIGGNYSASPIYPNGLIYFFSQEGKTSVLRPGDSFELVAVNELSEGCHGSPAVVGNPFIVRTDSHLYRLGD